VCGGIFPANSFSNDLRSLGYAFHSIKDANLERGDFEKLVKDALPEKLAVDFVIVHDPAKTESSLTLQGQLSCPEGSGPGDKNAKKQSKLPEFISGGDLFTTQELANALPVAPLFCKGSSGVGFDSDANLFQYCVMPAHSAAGMSAQGGNEDAMETLPLRGSTSKESSSSLYSAEPRPHRHPLRQSNSRKRAGSPSLMQRRGHAT
jgi:hypothetical protein